MSTSQYKLVIVESPSKCKKIESYLGKGYKCMATFGHLRTLKYLKDIDIKHNFTPLFRVIPEKKKQISKLKKIIKSQDCIDVILATDDDREGEAIAWHICELFHLPVDYTKRIVFHEITKTALQSAVKTPTRIDMNKVHAQHARQVLDLLVGFKISQQLWKHIHRNKDQGLSAGRCQTPALRIIYDNNETSKAKGDGTAIYKITGEFAVGSTGIASYSSPSLQPLNISCNLNTSFDTEKEVRNFLKKSIKYQHLLTKKSPKTISKAPPKPFTTSRIQQVCSNKINCSPKQTMYACQRLYESGLITYMRTDSTTYSAEFIKNANTFISSTWGEEFIGNEKQSSDMSNKSTNANRKGKSKTTKNTTKKVAAQEAHESIRPTDITLTNIPCNNTSNAKIPAKFKKLSSLEIRIYRIIWENTISSCMSPAIYNSLSYKITAPQYSHYKGTVEEQLFAGWEAVYAGVYNDDGLVEPTCITAAYSILEKMVDSTSVNYTNITGKMSVVDIGTHLTEARLIQELEKRGIGRPSTFSTLVDKIQERKYVKKCDVLGCQIECTHFKLTGDIIGEERRVDTFGAERNKLVLQPVGGIVSEFLHGRFTELFEYDYTKAMEDTLDAISQGTAEWYELCGDCYNMICSLCGDLEKETSKQVFPVDETYTYVIGRYGPVLRYSDLSGNTKIAKIKEDIEVDIGKLKKGEYTANYLLEDGYGVGKSVASKKEQFIGVHENKDIVLKNGRYGWYITWNNITVSIPTGHLWSGDKDEDYKYAVHLINGKLSGGGYGNNAISCKGNILRCLHKEVSIRRGKWGAYVYYKTNLMTKPRFIACKKLKWETMTDEEILEWLKTAHDIQPSR
jgi:DNA topoisomerase I